MVKINNISIGDFLTFKASDGLYRVIFCSNIFKERSPHFFDFGATSISKYEKPTISDVINAEFYGKGNRNSFRFKEKELDKMWKIHPEIKPYYLGIFMLLITRKGLVSFRERLEFICNLPILENLEQNGTGGTNVSTIESLNGFFIEDTEDFMDKQSQCKYKIEAIIKE